MARGMFEESRTLSELAQQETDFFRFLGNLLSMEDEGLLNFTRLGEQVVLKSAVTFLEMLTPTEIETLQNSELSLDKRFPASRYNGFAEYSALLQVLGLDEPGLPPTGSDEESRTSPVAGECPPTEPPVDEPMAESTVSVPWDEPVPELMPQVEDNTAVLPAPVPAIPTVPPAVPSQKFELAIAPTLESYLEKGRHFLAEGWPGLARDRFEDALALEPRSVLAKAYLAWMDFTKQPHSTSLREVLNAALDKALLIYDEDADMLTFRGMLWKLDGDLKAAENLLRKAVSGDPKHALAVCQLRILTQRQKDAEEWPSVDLRTIHLDAPIIIQRRVLGRTKTYSFREREIRIGSSDQDHVSVSPGTLSQLAKRHCLVISRGGRHFVRRVASLGRVWINGREIDVRKDEPVLPDDCIRLGQSLQGPALEFRVFDVKGMAMPT